MTFSRLVEIGRVGYIVQGENEGKLCAIVDIIDANKALIDGPGLKRGAQRFSCMHLTKFSVTIPHSARTRTVRKAWETGKIDEKWKASTWASKLAKRQLRANMTDFDRFKLMKAKQMRNRIVRKHMAKIKKSGSGGAKKGPKAKKSKK